MGRFYLLARMEEAWQMNPHRTPIRFMDVDTYSTVEFPKLKEADRLPLDRLELIKTGLDLLVELWPKPGYASVTLETHQWNKLRRFILAVPELVANDE